MIKTAFGIWIYCLISLQLFGQNCSSERYLSNIFQSSVTQDVVFGTSPALTAVYIAENVTVNQEMTMDVFFPVGDYLPKRPAVVLAYGGGYLFGTKEDEDVWTTCDSLAKKGYVTASINYRMNMNVASPASAIRAIYRAAQDYSSAIRYLKEFSDTYAIDTNYVFVGGVSAGGFSAMHAVFLDENERPAETFQSGILGVNPDLGCVSCEGNSYNHTNNVRGIINLWGALMDTAYIQQDELVPMTLFHGTNDLIVPNDFGFPFTALFLMPEVFGSTNITNRVNNLGGNAELNLFQGVGHNIWGLNVNNVMVGGPTVHWSPITDSIISFLYENIRPEPIAISANAVCEGMPTTLTAAVVPTDGRVCWAVEGAQIVSANADSSEVTVVWNTPGQYGVTATAINHLEAYSEPTTTVLEVYSVPTVSISNNNGLLQASGNYPIYQWYMDGVAVSGANQATLVPTGNGSYTVEAISNDGCISVSDPFALVGLNELLTDNANISRIELFDITGRFLQSVTPILLKTMQISIAKQTVIAKYYDFNGVFVKAELSVVTATF